MDDDEGLRRLVARVLARKGYDVTTAASGDEGIAMTASQAFDLVAVDHYMPGRDGLSTLEGLRALPDCPPIVYVTGSEESRIAVAALKAGAQDYVVKAVGDDFFDLLAQSFAQVLEATALRQARDRAEQDLRASNARLETLLREVNHRVANNLQMVMAFVSMQARSVDNEAARDALYRAHQRIATIAQVNRRLYTTNDVEFVAIDDYLAALASDMGDAWSAQRPRTVTVDADPARLKTDLAVTIGLAANELVGNACKYAYPADAEGEVRVTLRLTQQADAEARLMLCVEDDGWGMPPDGTVHGTGLGTRLIDALTRSRGARLAHEAVHPGEAMPGTRACLTLTLNADDLCLGDESVPADFTI
ncbi:MULTISPECIES: sensor histidine kinase [Novosphingobium]|uniref:sensor histidine kinase n=1 Tax=Novosphingobium TaxID=165696 RepID=UPI002100F24F|nr:MULTISPECIES: response regulator [Novosphingobium]